MSNIVDSHTPLKTKQIKVVPSAPWLRRILRKVERKYTETGPQVHEEDFVNLRKETKRGTTMRRKLINVMKIVKHYLAVLMNYPT